LKPEESFVDCSMTEESMKKAVELQEQFNKYNVTYCFVSPLLRCMESAYHVLSSHPNKANIKVFVTTLLSEHLSCSTHNVCTNTDKKKVKYNSSSIPSFDWKYFDESARKLKNENLFYLDFIDNKNINSYQEIIDKLEDNYCFDHISQFLVSYVNINQFPESFNSLNKRCKKFKAMLKDFIKEKNIDVKKRECISLYAFSCD